MKRWGFKEGLKVDLFPPYPDSPYFLERMNEFECHKTRFIQGDICKLTGFVPADSVDMIGCSAVLDLMDTPDRNLFYSEAYDVLRPGGVLTVYYTGLVYGHNDWGNGCQDMENATTLGFEWLDGSPVHMILHKPLAKEDAKDKEGEGRG
jgi:SAM-dependent methyltransferase